MEFVDIVKVGMRLGVCMVEYDMNVCYLMKMFMKGISEVVEGVWCRIVLIILFEWNLFMFVSFVV